MLYISNRSVASDRDGLGRLSAGNLTVAGATAAWKLANVVLRGCRLTHAGSDLQGFGNLGDEAGPFYALISRPV